MLDARTKIIQKFMEATEKGTIPKDFGLLRRCRSLCNQLPAIDSVGFQKDFLNVCNSNTHSFRNTMTLC